jgi:hypothetical protein
MHEASVLILKVKRERELLIETVATLTTEQASYKPTPECWSINEKLEHLVLAEVSGVSKI